MDRSQGPGHDVSVRRARSADVRRVRTTAGPNYVSTIATTHDAGDRSIEIDDSLAGTIERTYDLLDRLIEEEIPEGTITYTYDDAGRRTTMQVAGQTAVSYGYDTADRLTSITQGAGTVTLAYDDADRRSSLTLPNGNVVEYGYDDDSRLTSLTYRYGGSPIGTLTYVYDSSGQRASVGGTWARTSLPVALASATYDDANQIATFGGTSFTYDDNGNLTSDGVRSYTWNARNQLASLTGAVNGSFAYDGVGRRRAKTIGGTTTQFLYDGLNPVQELASGTPTANLLTGLGIDEYFTRTDAAGVRNFLTDALESSVGLADGSGVVQTEYTYEPFGVSNTVGSATTNAIGFTGREADGTGLYFYRARYYSPGFQRFVSEDPVQFAGGTTNLHEYVASDPVNGIDPTGLQIPVPIPLPTPGPIPTFPWIPGHEPKDLLPPIDPSPVPRTIPDPKKPGRCRCACICRADADDTMPGNIKPEWPRFAFGSAIAANCSTARKEAEKKAKHILGMKAKHVQCKCAG